MLRKASTFLVLTGLMSLSPLQAVPPASGAVISPPATFLDEAGTRFITVEWHEDKKVKIALRSVGAPGQYGRWDGDGEQTDKGIIFAQTVEEGDRGAFYLATGGQGRLVVKLKPGQPGVQDGGLVGVYHHITDDKITSLLKKDSELAEKKVDETLKLAAHHVAADDRPALIEWKKRWPDLRKRLTAFAGLPPVKYSAGAAPPKPGDPPTVPAEKGAVSAERNQTAYWMALAESSGSASAFLVQPLPPGLKPGWDGLYDDGFGGSADLQLLKSGGVKMILNASRIGGAQSGTVEEFIPPDRVKNNPNGTDGTADFTDKNPEVKDPTQQTQIHLHRIGHFLIIETQYAERYANRAWFDGVYVKRPSPPAE